MSKNTECFCWQNNVLTPKLYHEKQKRQSKTCPKHSHGKHSDCRHAIPDQSWCVLHFFVFGATLFFFAHKHALCVCVCARHTEKLDVFHNFLTGSIPTEIGQLSTIGEFMPLCYAPSACILVVVLLLLLFGTALIPLFFNSRAHVSCPRSALAWTKPNRRSHSIHNGSLDQTR